MPAILHSGTRLRPFLRCMNMIAFPGDRLRCQLENSDSDSVRDFLLLDCRPFLTYSQGHIASAVNVHCPSILRRRSGGRLPLRTVIPDMDVREKLQSGSCMPVVLYDDCGRSPQEDSMVTFVARCLQLEVGLKTIFILEGGFQEFHLLFPHLCAQPASVRSSSCSSLSSSASLSGKLSSGSTGSPGPYPYSFSARSAALLTPGKHIQLDQDGPVEILPHLYLGSAPHAASKEVLLRLGITALLNVSQSCPNHFQDSFVYKSIPIQDSGNEDIGAWFSEAIQFIESAKVRNGRVLVHCHAGISRSATICMAYIMATKRLRMEEAYEYVKCRRRIVSPNFNFMGQLLSFESQVFSPRALWCRKTSNCSPRSPLLATAAAVCSPHPDALTPSRGATQNVFDFANALGLETSACNSPTLTRSPACVT